MNWKVVLLGIRMNLNTKLVAYLVME